MNFLSSSLPTLIANIVLSEQLCALFEVSPCGGFSFFGCLNAKFTYEKINKIKDKE